jgi:hypothetical protein
MRVKRTITNLNLLSQDDARGPVLTGENGRNEA